MSAPAMKFPGLTGDERQGIDLSVFAHLLEQRKDLFSKSPITFFENLFTFSPGRSKVRDQICPSGAPAWDKCLGDGRFRYRWIRLPMRVPDGYSNRNGLTQRQSPEESWCYRSQAPSGPATEETNLA